MMVWKALLAVMLFPGRLVLARFPKLKGEEARLLFNMTNYIFWLTPLIGGAIWLVIVYPPIGH